MIRFLEHFVISLWNRIQGRRTRRKNGNGHDTVLGFRIVDEEPTSRRIGMSATRRTMHTTIVGKSGTGKTSFIKHLCAQDIAAGRGLFVLDLHGDVTPFILSAIAAEEWRQQEHLSDKLIVISPADHDFSVGLNPLEDADPDFARIAEFAEVLRQRWGLDHFGARTDELLRNALNTRLLALYRAGLLRRFFIGSGGGRKALYAISPKGAQLIQAPNRGPRRRTDEMLVADFFVLHQLAVNEVFCSLKFGKAAVSGLQFVQWLSFYAPLAQGWSLHRRSSQFPSLSASVSSPTSTIAAITRTTIATSRKKTPTSL